jgi:hypothetical protein
MAQRKTLEQQIASAKLEMEQKENRLKELLGKQKEQDRKARTNRLCMRMGIIEKYLPDTIPLTDEQFIAFVECAVANDDGKRKLDHIISQGADKYPPKTAETTPPQGNADNAKPAEKAPTEGNPTPAKPTGAKANTSGTPPTTGGNSVAKAG